MEFDFNVQNIGRKFFVHGCDYCGSDVEFKSVYEAFGDEYNEKYVYICSNEDCRAYTPAHQETKGLAIKYHPQGILASPELRQAHDILRTRFNALWQQKKINHLFFEYVLSFQDVNDELRYGIVKELDKDKREYRIVCETGESFRVPFNKTEKISLRTKCYFYLAQRLGLTVQACQIPLFDLDQTYEAIRILEHDLKSIEEPTNQTI